MGLPKSKEYYGTKADFEKTHPDDKKWKDAKILPIFAVVSKVPCQIPVPKLVWDKNLKPEKQQN